MLQSSQKRRVERGKREKVLRGDHGSKVLASGGSKEDSLSRSEVRSVGLLVIGSLSLHGQE